MNWERVNIDSIDIWTRCLTSRGIGHTNSNFVAQIRLRNSNLYSEPTEKCLVQPKLKLIKCFVGRRLHKLFRGLGYDNMYTSRWGSLFKKRIHKWLIVNPAAALHAYHMLNLTKTTAYLNSLNLISNSKCHGSKLSGQWTQLYPYFDSSSTANSSHREK